MHYTSSFCLFYFFRQAAVVRKHDEEEALRIERLADLERKRLQGETAVSRRRDLEEQERMRRARVVKIRQYTGRFGLPPTVDERPVHDENCTCGCKVWGPFYDQ